MATEKPKNQTNLPSCAKAEVDNLPFGKPAGQLPGWIHFNRLDDLSVFWMPESMEKDLQVNSKEVAKMGPDFLKSIIDPETEKRVIPQILSYLESGDDTEPLGFTHMVRKNKKQPYAPYYTIIKKSSEYNCFFCQSIPINSM